MDEKDYKIRPFPATGMGTESHQASFNNTVQGSRVWGTWHYPTQYPTAHPDTTSNSLSNPYQPNFPLPYGGQLRYSEYNNYHNPMFWTPSTSSLNQEISSAEQPHVKKDRLFSSRNSLQQGRPSFARPFQDPSSAASSFENNPYQPSNPSGQTFNPPPSYQTYIPVPSMSVPPQLCSHPALADHQSVGYDTSIGSIQPAASTPLTQEILARMRILYASLFNLYNNSNKIMSAYRNSQVFQVYYDVSMTMWYLGKTASEVIQLISSSLTPSSTLPLSMDANLVGNTSMSTSRMANPRAREDSVMETEPKAAIDAFASIITRTKEFVELDTAHPRTDMTFSGKSTEDRVAELESSLREVIKHIYGELDVDAILEAAGLASLATEQSAPSTTADYLTGSGDEPVYSRDALLAMDKNKLVEKIEAQNMIIDNLRHTFSLVSSNITTLSQALIPSSVVATTDESNEATPSIIDKLMQQLTERTTQLASAQKRLSAAEAELKCLKAERERWGPLSAG